VSEIASATQGKSRISVAVARSKAAGILHLDKRAPGWSGAVITHLWAANFLEFFLDFKKAVFPRESS